MSDIMDRIRSNQTGFQMQSVEVREAEEINQPTTSPLSQEAASEFAQMLHLEGGEGVIMYFPKKIDFEVGEVLYLRERKQGENGLIVQAFEKGTASYPQADSKALFRLMTAVSAYQIQRSHHEPPETIDEFMELHFKVRAAIINGAWSAPEGRVVTRNVDIFKISPQLLIENVVQAVPNMSLHLGDYQNEDLTVAGEGFDKVNLVTGMKGAGKSHITKGIINESLKLNMSSVVFDINNEYDNLTPNAAVLRPGSSGNFKFRLDRMDAETFLALIRRLSPFPPATELAANAEIPLKIQERIQANHIPDIPFLRDAVNQIFPGNSPVVNNMRSAYLRSLENVEKYNLVMTEQEAQAEDAGVRNGQPAQVRSLITAFHNTFSRGAQLIVFKLGGLSSTLQRSILTLVIDYLKELCAKQSIAHANNPTKYPYPIYPTVFFEEAHMYMDEQRIEELVPLIRHIGINVFFITNTPGALPESVFRLVDNIIMTRMFSRKDIDRIVDCGLTDKETIYGFARNLKDRHALFLSAKEGATKNFPLVFRVRDFNLPKSGQTRSQWRAMREHLESQQNAASTNTDSSSSTTQD
ncbi:MAG: DUF853 family protein [Pyrinomonadaceae bacterium MAG19_C2-C3]|nr:DUF853 family protein [Pyrinomonadaceae bacterium MAG19_C2-C3]